MDSNERKAAARKLARQVSQMSAEQRAEFSRRFPAIITIEGRALSPFNTCLVAMQNPGATVVGGFRQWIKSGRAVRKGEHGMAIWVPLKRGAKDDGEQDSGDECRFILGTVFDVSQTSEIETGKREAQNQPEQRARGSIFPPAGRLHRQRISASTNSD